MILYFFKVAFLQISRPKGFRFHVGDYVYVNIPSVAKYEWHPFTISSCPEREGEHKTTLSDAYFFRSEYCKCKPSIGL